MTSALKKNGPASPASDPDLGSLHPCKGKKMNADTDTTRAAVAAMIKLPYANASPCNDLADGISILRVVLEVMGDDRGMTSDFATDIHATIAAAVEKIDPVFTLLDKLDKLDLIELYRESRIASGTGSTVQAAMLMSAVAGDKSMIGLVANLIYMIDPDDPANRKYPFAFSGGILRANQMRIGFAQIDDVEIDFATITDVHVTGDMIVDGSIDSPSLALKAVTDSASASLPSTTLSNSAGSYVNFLSITVSNAVANPILVSIYLALDVTNGSLSVRLLRNGSELSQYTQSISAGVNSSASKVYGPSVSFDAGAPTGSVTYVIQYAYSPGGGGGSNAHLRADLAGMIFKR